MNAFLRDRYGEVRVPWRVVLGIMLMGVCVSGGLFIAAALGRTTTWELGAAALSGEILATWILTRFLNRKPLAAIGVGLSPNPLPDLVRGTALGLIAIGTVSLVLWIPGHVTFSLRPLPVSEIAWVTVSSLTAVFVSAAAEEVFFRGYLFQTLIQGITLLPASLVMSLLFALAHARNPGFAILGGVNTGLAGLVFCVAYAKTRRLWLPLGFHSGWNFAQMTLCGYPGSGLVDPDRMLCTGSVTGPEWWTGGAFGPEGGLAATAALIACAWYMLKSQSFRTAPGLVTLDSMEDLIAGSKN